MGVLTLFEKRLRGSDWGKPTDRDTKGFDVRVLNFEGFVHLEMKRADADESSCYMALFSLSEAKACLKGLESAIHRVEKLGEM